MLASFNIFPTKVHLQTIMKSFGQDGCLSVDAFMAALRPPLNARRAAVTKAAWDLIDVQGAGCVPADRLSECYDVSRNQDFIEGSMTKEQIFGQFMEGLSYNCQPVTEVRSEYEWRFYQEDLSLTIVEDEYFVRMTEAVWGVAEDATATVTKQEVEHVVSLIRKRCRDISSVNQSADAVLRAIYREVDGPARSGELTCEMLSEVLKRLQILVDSRFLEALMKPFDREGNGCIEFEELVGYLMEKPYK